MRHSRLQYHLFRKASLISTEKIKVEITALSKAKATINSNRLNCKTNLTRNIHGKSYILNKFTIQQKTILI